MLILNLFLWSISTDQFVPLQTGHSFIGWFDLVSSLKGISTFLGYLMPKLFLYKNSSSTILTHSWRDKRVHAFPKVICPKVNVKAELEFKLTYYSIAVKQVSHYATETPHVHYFLDKSSAVLLQCLNCFALIF